MSLMILNFGSINIDHVYRVSSVVEPGQTLACTGLSSGLGGKGANQSVAVAAAGGRVTHLGRLGRADAWALDVLASRGVNTDLITLVDEPSGHAMIQLDDRGENAIIVHGGANQGMQLKDLEAALDRQPPVGFLLLQNECNLLAQAIDLAHRRQIPVILNPAPMSERVADLPLNKLDTLVVNETEASALTRALTGTLAKTPVDSEAQQDLAQSLRQKFPELRIVCTKGSAGVRLFHGDEQISVAAPKVPVVDTTAAGDTFVGYFAAGLAEGMTNRQALERAVLAGAVAVTRAGAIASIPTADQLWPAAGV